MKAIYYVRVSTGSQTVDRQIDDIKRYCILHEIELLDTDFQEIESGKMKVRPVLTEMEKYIDEHPNEIDFVIISELSRLGRTSKVLETIENLHSKKIGLISLHEKITTLDKNKLINHSSSLLIAILTSINGYELETTKYRSISGLEKSIRKGNAGGSSNYPYGYMKDENKKLIRNEKEVETIKLIFKLYLEGNGTQKISNILNADETILTRTEQLKNDGLNKSEYKFGGKWVDGTIYSILKNPIYSGWRRRRTHYDPIQKKDKVIQRPIYELLEFPYLKIIEPDEFQKVQNLLHSNYNKSNKHNVYEYLLDPKKIICGCCLRDRNIIRHYFPHKKEDKNDNRYMCLSRRKKEQCSNAGINIDKLEYIIQQIILFMFEDKLIEKLDNKQLKKQIDDLSTEIPLLRKVIEKIDNNVLNIVRKEIDGELDRPQYLKMLNEYKSQKEQVLNKLNNKLETKFTLNETYNNMKDIKKLKLNFHKGNKIPKDVVNKIISNITITKQDTYPELFKNKQDKVLELKILSGDKEYIFLISHRENIVFYCHKNGGFVMNKFFVNQKNIKLSGKYFQHYNESYNKKLFNFFTE